MQSQSPNLECLQRPDSGRSAGGNLPSCSSRSSASWLRGSLQSGSGRNLDGIVDCSSAGTLGWNLTRYSARTRRRISRRCLRNGGRSSAGNSRTNSRRRSSPSPLHRDFASCADSYGGGIGGDMAAMVNSGLRIRNLGRIPAAAGMCAIVHISADPIRDSVASGHALKDHEEPRPNGLPRSSEGVLAKPTGACTGGPRGVPGGCPTRLSSLLARGQKGTQADEMYEHQTDSARFRPLLTGRACACPALLAF